VILHLKEKQILAESSKGRNKYRLELKSLYSEIFSKVSSDQISIDNKNLFTYKKYNSSVFVTVSAKTVIKKQPFIFIEELKKNIEKDYKKSLNKLIDSLNNNISEYSMQDSIGKTIDNTIKLFNSDFPESLKTIENINNDVESIKENLKENVNKQISNIQDLEKPLLKAQEIKELAKEFRREADNTLDKTKCWCSRKMKVLYLVFGILVLLFALYAVTAFIRCRNLNAFCGGYEVQQNKIFN